MFSQAILRIWEDRVGSRPRVLRAGILISIAVSTILMLLLSHHSFKHIDITGEMQSTLNTNHAGSKWEAGSSSSRVFPLQTGAATDSEIGVTLLRHWFEQVYWRSTFVDATLVDSQQSNGRASTNLNSTASSRRQPWLFGSSLVDIASISSIGITGRYQGESTHDGHNVLPPLEGTVWNTLLTVWGQLLRKKYPSLQYVSKKVTFETVCKDQVMKAHAPWCGWSTADIVKTLQQNNNDGYFEEDSSDGNVALQKKDMSPRKQLELNVKSLQNIASPSNSTLSSTSSSTSSSTKEQLDRATVDGIQWTTQLFTMDDVTYLQGGGYLYHPRVGSIRKNLKKIEKIGSDFELRARNIVNTPVKMALVNNQYRGRKKSRHENAAICVSGPIPPYLHQTGKRLKRFVLASFSIQPHVHVVNNEDGHEYYAEKITTPAPTTPTTEDGGTEPTTSEATSAADDSTINTSSFDPSTTTVLPQSTTTQPPSPSPSSPPSTTSSSNTRAKASADHIVFAEKLRMINHLIQSSNDESRILLLGDSQRWNSEKGGWVPVFPHTCLACVRWMQREGCHASIVSSQLTDTKNVHPKYILLTRTDTSFEVPVYFDFKPPRVHLGGYCRSAASYDPHFPATPYHVGCSQLLGPDSASTRSILVGDVGTAIRDLHQVQDAVVFGHVEAVTHIMCMFSLILSNGGLGYGKSSWVTSSQFDTSTTSAKQNDGAREEAKDNGDESTTATTPPPIQDLDPISFLSPHYDTDTHVFGRYIRTFLRPFYRVVHELSPEESTSLSIGLFPFPVSRQILPSSSMDDASEQQQQQQQQLPDNVVNLDQRRYDNRSLCYAFTFHRRSNVTATTSHATHGLSRNHHHYHLQHGDLGYVSFTPLEPGSCFNGVDGYSPWGGVLWCGYQNGSIITRTSRRDWLGKNASCFPFCNFWRVPSLMGVCAAPQKWTPPTLSEDQMLSKFTRHSTPPTDISDLWTPAYFSWTPPRNVEGVEEGSSSSSHHHLDVLDISITDQLKIYQPSSMA